MPLQLKRLKPANLFQNSVVEELLKFFVAIVDTELLEAVHLKVF